MLVHEERATESENLSGSLLSTNFQSVQPAILNLKDFSKSELLHRPPAADTSSPTPEPPTQLLSFALIREPHIKDAF